MTCREQFEIDHPFLVSKDTSMNVIGCPSMYGYSDEESCSKNSNNCDDCWSRPVQSNKGDNKR